MPRFSCEEAGKGLVTEDSFPFAADVFAGRVAKKVLGPKASYRSLAPTGFTTGARSYRAIAWRPGLELAKPEERDITFTVHQET